MVQERIENYLLELRQTVSVANLHYEVWRLFKDKEVLDEFLKTINKYPLFFQTTIHAHFVTTIVALYRIYEKRSDTYNIQGLFKLIKKTNFSSKKISELEGLYEQSKPLWVKVSILRNKAFGHRNNQLTVLDVFKEAGVKPNEFQELMELTKKILNIISYEWNQSTHAFNLGAENSTKLLLKDLKKFHEQHSNRIAGGFSPPASTTPRMRVRTGRFLRSSKDHHRKLSR